MSTLPSLPGPISTSSPTTPDKLGGFGWGFSFLKANLLLQLRTLTWSYKKALDFSGNLSQV